MFIVKKFVNYAARVLSKVGEETYTSTSSFAVSFGPKTIP